MGNDILLSPDCLLGGLEVCQLKTYDTDKLVMIEVVTVNLYTNYIVLGLSTLKINLL